MKAIVLREFGGPEVLRLEEVPEPSPGFGEVLIKVAACGVCYHDLLTRQGVIRHGLSLPVVPGHEIAGEIVAVGDGVEQFRVGDRVCTVQLAACGACSYCLSGEDNLCARQQMFGHGLAGGYGEYVVAPERSLVKVPASIPLTEAAVFGCGIGTSYRALKTTAQVRAGETVLVNGAGGGTGLHSVQLARAFGARVIAVTGSPQKAETIRACGADEVIVAEDGHYHQQVQALTDGGVDVVLDHVGTPLWASTIRSVRNGGRIAFIGQVSGEALPFNPGLIILRSITLAGSKGASVHDLQQVVKLAAWGKIKPMVGTVLPLSEAAEAHRRMEARATVGRVVLEVA